MDFQETFQATAIDYVLIIIMMYAYRELVERETYFKTFLYNTFCTSKRVGVVIDSPLTS